MVRRSVRDDVAIRVLIVLAACALFYVAIAAKPASAIPIFAQRYRLSCETCHTAIPELNAFGNAFRQRGYQLPANVPRHGTTIAAIRYNMEYEKDPAPGTRRFSPVASIVADADLGKINAYVHYGLGAGGAPAAMYLGFLSTFNDHTKSEYRLGLFELPLTQSPGQRLDSISEYGYFGTSVGQNDLDLNAPRLGFEAERQIGEARFMTTLSMGEFKGAAYGGKPVFTGAETTAERPEAGLFARVPLWDTGLTINAQALNGARNIALPGRAVFIDQYSRGGLGIDALLFKGSLDVTAQQWVGRDDDPDGAGDGIDSSGGYARVKYFLNPHLFAALRYDDAANPFPTRTAVAYAGAMVLKHTRVVIERRVNLIRGTPTLGGYVTIAVPWPPGV